MQKLTFLFLICLLPLAGQAQKAKPKKVVKKPKITVVKKPSSATDLDKHPLSDGQAVALDVATGSLSFADAANTNPQGQKRYFDRYTLTLRQGDLLVVEYASEIFRVMLGLEKPDKQTVFSHDSVAFENVSVHQFKFDVPATGTYTLSLTSADPQQTGDYTVRKFILPVKAIFPEANADFCQKLAFLMAQSQLQFNRLEGKKTRTEKKTGLIETYQARYEVVPGKTSEIVRDRELGKSKLNATLAEFTKKEEALKALETYAAQLRACTPGWQYETLEGDTFKEISAATYVDFLTVSMRILGKKKFAVVLGVD
ncbi:MAG: hypothetical protein LH606_17385 [Cytophagaceae bacterium]|nr:hypothetical protein [Cytophagaceae bacterium]